MAPDTPRTSAVTLVLAPEVASWLEFFAERWPTWAEELLGSKPSTEDMRRRNAVLIALRAPSTPAGRDGGTT